jgi:hypothetical protein
VHTLITDDAIATRDAKLVEQTGIRLIVAGRDGDQQEASVSVA